MEIKIDVLNDQELIAKFNKARDDAKSRLEKGLSIGAGFVKTTAQTLIHVLTGATKASIYTQVAFSKVGIGATTPYAGALEARYPFLEPALVQNKTKIEQAVSNEMGNMFKEIFPEGFRGGI